MTENIGNEKAPSGFWGKIQPYQNVIFFVLLIIFLGILLLVWRGYRVRIMTQQAWDELTNVQPSSEIFRGMVQRYQSSSILPIIKFRLACALAAEEKFQEAGNEYYDFIKKYPDHPFKKDAEEALKKLEDNIKWLSGEFEKSKAELKEKRNLPYLTVKTSKGDFEVELFEDEAPNTVANFISLVESGFYNQMLFNDIGQDETLSISDSKVISPTAGITQTVSAEFKILFETSGINNEPGYIGMLRDLDPDAKDNAPEKESFLNSANYRFYINLKRAPDKTTQTDTKYTIFGRIIKGAEVLFSIDKGTMILGITVDKKRSHPYTPSRLYKVPETPPVVPPEKK
jgi:peptidyl-prolyl cis-trans isomerase B (cyclophilin B)